MPIDMSKAAAAHHLVIEQRRPMAVAAKTLCLSGTYEVGELLKAHKKAMDADNLVRSKKAGVGPRPAVAHEVAAREHREWQLERARRLIAEGVEVSDICDRLGVDSRVVTELPEYRARAAERLIAPRRERKASAEDARAAGRARKQAKLDATKCLEKIKESPEYQRSLARSRQANPLMRFNIVNGPLFVKNDV